MPRPLHYPWAAATLERGTSALSLEQLRARVELLRARQAELERIDTRGMRPARAREVDRERRDELAALRYALQSSEHELVTRQR